jgi:hypothetical protein
MTSSIIIAAIGLLLFSWVLNLVRKGRVFIEYGSALVIVIAGIICLSLIPTRFVEAFMHGAGKIMPGSASIFLAIYGILFVLICVLRELTAISRRLRTLTQQLAIELARRGGRTDSEEPLSKAQCQIETLARVSEGRRAESTSSGFHGV